MNANFRAEKYSGPSRYGRYGSYATLVPWLRSGATALDPQNRAYITEPQRLRLCSDKKLPHATLSEMYGRIVR